MCSTWFSAVRCEITSSPAISLLLRPPRSGGPPAVPGASAAPRRTRPPSAASPATARGCRRGHRRRAGPGRGVSGLVRRLAQGLPGLALAVPVVARQGLVALQGGANGLPQAGGGAEQDRGALVLVPRRGDPCQRFHAERAAHPVVAEAAAGSAVLARWPGRGHPGARPPPLAPTAGKRSTRGGCIRCRPRPARRAPGGRRRRAPRHRRGGDHQGGQELGALAVVDGCGQDRLPPSSAEPSNRSGLPAPPA